MSETAKIESRIRELALHLNSAIEQYEDSLLNADQLQKQANKLIADYKAGDEIGNIWLKMPFGTHKDEKIAELPTRYLKYIISEDWFETKFPEHYSEAKETLELRGEL